MWAGLYINFDKVRGLFYKIKCRLKLTECGLDYINELSIIDNKVTMFFSKGRDYLVYSIIGSVIAHYAVCKCVRRFNPSTIYIKRVGFAEVLGCFLLICYSWSVN